MVIEPAPVVSYVVSVAPVPSEPRTVTAVPSLLVTKVNCAFAISAISMESPFAPVMSPPVIVASAAAVNIVDVKVA